MNGINPIWGEGERRGKAVKNYLKLPYDALIRLECW